MHYILCDLLNHAEDLRHQVHGMQSGNCVFIRLINQVPCSISCDSIVFRCL